MGAFDFFLKIVTRDIDAYEKFVFGVLSKLPALQEINSTIVLSEVKSTTALPLRLR
jgi:Lrp/AsnC family transcriptional regulator